MANGAPTLSEARPASPATGHPPGLYVLFFAEMWERFCYYGMRTLLVLYLTKELLFKDEPAYGIYGAYTALVYAAPVIGGKMADNLLGYRRAVIMGGILMAIGEFLLVGNGILSADNTFLFVGMGVIIVGNGYFKANISSVVGKLYGQGDPRRDSGFTIFYMGINIGALLATTVCGFVGETFGYKYGFGLAGVGMLLGIAVFVLGQPKLEGLGDPPDPVKLHEPWKGPLSRWHVTVIASLGVVPVLYWLLQNEGIVNWLLGATMIAVCGSLLVGAIQAGKKEPAEQRTVQRDRIIALFVLMFFNTLFWALFEQAGTSLTLFADRAVDRRIDLLDWEMPTSNTQSFNPAFIIIFGSLFSWMWVKLDKAGLNPNIPMKFALGTLQLGCGFLLLLVGASMASDYKVALFFLVGMYLLHTTGELFVSPIGLSMVTKLAPAHLTGTVMGAWFLSFAFANKLGAQLAKLTGETPNLAGALANLVKKAQAGWAEPPVIPANISDAFVRALERAKAGWPEVAPPEGAEEALAKYIETYQLFGFVIVGVGVFLVLISGVLNKMMHGVK
jgi:POT family proton-dependent oligopeptide transporter